MRVLLAVALAAVLSPTAPLGAPPSPVALVACAPGYPGTTAEAQPSLDALAAALARGAGWPEHGVVGVYLPDEQEGLARLARPDAAVALVPAPFFAKHAAALQLTARLAAVGAGAAGPAEVWTLVAGKGRVGSPAALAGFTLASAAGYAPGFVRGALRGWGPLPPDVKIVFSTQVLSTLRRAAAGEPVAVLLDGAQAAALQTLPFAADLEVVARSAPVPGAMVVTVGARLPAQRWRALEAAFVGLPKAPGGPEVLGDLQLSAFVPLDAATRAAAERLAAESGR
jgi:hypothetical protein